MVETKTKQKHNFISFYINIFKNYVYIIFKRANAYFSRLDFLFEKFFLIIKSDEIIPLYTYTKSNQSYIIY